MNVKNLLVVPASKWQLGLIKYLKKKKFKVFSLDDDDDAVGHKHADERIHIRTEKIQNLKIGEFINNSNHFLNNKKTPLKYKYIVS